MQITNLFQSQAEDISLDMLEEKMVLNAASDKLYSAPKKTISQRLTMPMENNI